MSPDQLLPTFIAECSEQLAGMEAALLALDTNAIDAESVNSIFRAAHTIKGSAGIFGFNQVVAFTHVVESVLDAAREHKIAIDDALVTLLLSCGDYIGTLIDAAEAGTTQTDDAASQSGAELIERLNTYLSATAQKVPPAQAVQEPEPVAHAGDLCVGNEHWHISLRFGRDVMKNGMDPLAFLHYLEKFGSISDIVAIPDAIPAAAEMDPESCYLGFEVAFKSEADKATIENVFEFVRDNSAIRILPPNSHISEYIRLINELPEQPARLGEILVQCGTVTTTELESALATQRQSVAAPPPPIGAILVEQGSVHATVVDAAVAKQQRVKEINHQESRSVRVDADKLDHLINLVGELIISAAGTQLIARRAHVAELQESTATLSNLVEEVRDSALQLRMVKIGATFNRFQRVVHDVSRELGKDIDLVVRGEDAELDKTVVEKIGDPLMHLVRNAIDHGIESPEVRRAWGKPTQGVVTLNAYHDSGSIVIEVSDDGGGLNRDKILAKATERGLVEPGQALNDSEIYGFVFEPGFSTAEVVSNLSGRGVGMDVVKRNITALRGSVSINSQEGVGTTVTVRLPLTLAIINGFLVGLGKSVFVVPLDMIEECGELLAELEQDYTNLRGHVLPLIRLRQVFHVNGEPGPRENIVVVKHAGRKAGLVVDTLLGEFQTVIKPLSKMFNRVKCISGSSILGTGEVALILDVPALVQQATKASASTADAHDKGAVPNRGLAVETRILNNNTRETSCSQV